MRFQSRKASCGPASLVNALELLGIKRTEDEMSVASEQTPKGTGAHGLMKALTAVGRQSEVIYTKDSKAAHYALHYSLCTGRPMILCVDEWDHYIVAAGVLGDRILCIDSADNEFTLSYEPKDLLLRWFKSGKGGGYYGIVV